MFFRRNNGIPVAEYSPLLCEALWTAIQVANTYHAFGQIEVDEGESRDEGMQSFASDLARLDADADRLEILRAKLDSKEPKYKSPKLAHHFACRIVEYVYLRNVALTAAYAAKMRGEERKLMAATVNHNIYAHELSKYWGMFIYSLDSLEKKHSDLFQVLGFPDDLRAEILRLTNGKSFP